jgi:hypothetical protein
VPTGIQGNIATLAVGKQTAKGTPQATPTYKLKLTGGDIVAVTDTVELAETDASIQAGGTVKTGFRVQGTPEHYLRPDDFGLIAYLALGATAVAGTTPNFTHTATIAAAQPYATVFKAINTTTLVDRYSDCRPSQLVINGAAGGILTYAVTWGGLAALFGSTDPVLTPVTQAPLVWPHVTCTIGGAAPGTVQSFTLTINRNSQFIPGDIGMAQVDYVSAKVAVTGSVVLMFENDQRYRAFHTGTTGGTAPTATIFSEALNILAQVNANLSVAFDLAAIEYTNVSVPINVDGTTIVQTLEFRSKPATAIADYLEIITKNAVASY